MEACEVDCDILEGMVMKVRELVIVRDEMKHKII
jgi:hypothetical protein